MFFFTKFDMNWLFFKNLKTRLTRRWYYNLIIVIFQPHKLFLFWVLRQKVVKSNYKLCGRWGWGQIIHQKVNNARTFKSSYIYLVTVMGYPKPDFRVPEISRKMGLRHVEQGFSSFFLKMWGKNEENTCSSCHKPTALPKPRFRVPDPSLINRYICIPSQACQWACEIAHQSLLWLQSLYPSGRGLGSDYEAS